MGEDSGAVAMTPSRADLVPRAVDRDHVRRLLGQPGELVSRKVTDHLDDNCVRFIAHCPFIVVATKDAGGRADCSPRGDHPGFVRVLGPTRLAIPDRPGNKLLDSIENLYSDPGIGLVFLVPGVTETLRVNGTGYVSDEPLVLASLEAQGRTPPIAIIVDIEEVFLHCGKALIRSKLWDPASSRLAQLVPTAGEIVAGQLGLEPSSAAGLDQQATQGYRTDLY